MSTRCIIGIRRPHQIDSIWCRSDGYPKGEHSVGECLNTHYTEEEKILKLIAFGDIEELTPDIENLKLFTGPYSPDRTPPVTTYTGLALHARGGAEWFYLFNSESGLWLFSKCHPKKLLSSNFKNSDSILDAHIHGVICGDPSTYKEGNNVR